MTPNEKESGRNMGQYAMFLLVVVALVLTPIVLYLLALPVSDIVRFTIIAVVAAIVIAGVLFAMTRSRTQG